MASLFDSFVEGFLTVFGILAHLAGGLLCIVVVILIGRLIWYGMDLLFGPAIGG